MAENEIDRVWKLIEKIGFCMLSTHEGPDIRGRPMSAYANRGGHAIYFLTDAGSHKNAAIVSDPNVGLTFADTSAQKYVSVSGHAAVSDDRAQIKELWSTPAKAWWKSPDDPSIRILKFTPTDAQYWDSPGAAVSYIKMAAAALSDSRPSIGHHGGTRL